MVFRSFLRALALSFSMSALACTPTVTATHVERGETVTTGNAGYDTFFRDVIEVKAEADKAGAELKDVAKPLREVIGATSAPPSDAVRTEAKKLQMSGTLLHLDLVPEAKMAMSGKAEAPSQKLLDAAEKTAKDSLAIARRAGDLLGRVADLEKRRGELEGTASSAFPDAKKRGEVTRELAAAGDALKAARETGEKHGGAASKLALDLAMALETGAGPSAVASAKKPTKPGAGGPRPAGTGTTAGPAKPKGGGSDEFDK